MDYLENRFNYTVPTELNLYYCGKRVKTKDHKYGPQIRDHFLLVYIKEGNATLHIGNYSSPMTAGQLLCMFPNEKRYYSVDRGNLWSILWVGIYGTKADYYIKNIGITRQNPVYTCPNPTDTECSIEKIINSSNINNVYGKLSTISELYGFFSTLHNKNSDKTIDIVTPDKIHETDTHEIVYLSDNTYIREAETYIRFNYDSNITIRAIANSLNLSVEYFSRLFKSETGITPQNMIINYRIKKACFLLENSNLTISEIAYCVGIKDQRYFSKLFRAKVGCTPSLYKKSKSNVL